MHGGHKSFFSGIFLNAGDYVIYGRTYSRIGIERLFISLSRYMAGAATAHDDWLDVGFICHGCGGGGSFFLKRNKIVKTRQRPEQVAGIKLFSCS